MDTFYRKNFTLAPSSRSGGPQNAERWLSISGMVDLSTGMNGRTGIARILDGPAFGDYWPSLWRLVDLF